MTDDGPTMIWCTAWCLKNENVHCVVLGASSVDQLYEDMQAIQVGDLHCVPRFDGQVVKLVWLTGLIIVL